MFRSLRGRLVTPLLLLSAAARAAGGLMIGLFQDRRRRAGQAQAGSRPRLRCDCRGLSVLRGRMSGPPPGSYDDGLRRQLSNVAATALRDRPGIEGGLW